MKTLMLIASAMMSFLLVASPVRGNLAASKHLSNIGKPKEITVRSYVQDGLLAMYDGEFNDIDANGECFHNPSATTWKDLSGNGNNAARATGTIRWDEKSYSPIAGTVTAMKCPKSLLDDKEGFTIEVVANWHGSAMTLTSRQSTSSGIQINRPNSLALFWGAYGQYTSSAQYHLSLSYLGGSDLNLYADGTFAQKVANTATNIKKTKKDAYWVIGAYTHNGSGYSSMTVEGDCIYCIRIYGRGLTADEVAHNYAVDKERFGL